MKDARHEIAPPLVEELHRRALEYADVARALINDARRDGFKVERKRDHSLVTDADLAVEQALRARITAHYPDHGIIGEEFPALHPQAAFQWILDPIDGTEDFVHGVATFGSILALHYRGTPLVGVVDHPALGLRCHAAFGRGTYHGDQRVRAMDLAADVPNERLRVVLSARAGFVRYRDDGASFDALTRAFPNHRIYRSCFGHSVVAMGAVDAMVDYHDTLWDLAAAQILTEEAGGTYRPVGEFANPDGTRIYSAVLGRPAAVARICAVLASV